MPRTPQGEESRRKAGRKRCAAFLLLIPALVLAGYAPAQKQQPPANPEKPAAAAARNGEWWLSLGNWEQYGFVAGYEDCYVYEYRGSVGFTQAVPRYVEDLTEYFLADAERRKQSVSEALDALRGGTANERALGAAGDAPGPAHGEFDGKYWFDAEAGAQLGFVEGYLACHAAKLKDADAKFSKPPSEYVKQINKAYGITDDTDEVNAERAAMKIADVLHGLKDEEAARGRPVP